MPNTSAAEAIAAAQFARAGFHVSVQYGTNQPGYDLVVEKDLKPMLISVKGSQTGKWGLTQGHLSKADYHGAADKMAREAHQKPCLLPRSVPRQGIR